MPVFFGGEGTRELVRELTKELEQIGRDYEVILIVGDLPESRVQQLGQFAEELPSVRVMALTRSLREATALAVGFEQARGALIIACSEDTDVEVTELNDVLVRLDSGVDLAVASRKSRGDSWPNRLQSALFHFLVRWLTKTPFADITSGFRAMRREVIESLDLYGDLYSFLPIIAYRQGFVVQEVPLSHRVRHHGFGLYGPQVYWRRSIDLLTIFFLTRFTQRPLRFFGTLGLLTAGVGSVVLLYLAAYRMLGLGGISGRPLVLLGLLLVVLGTQSISIGLLGELIMFTRASRTTTYRVSQIRVGEPLAEAPGVPEDRTRERASGQ